jgi:hypothetical protein
VLINARPQHGLLGDEGVCRKCLQVPHTPRQALSKALAALPDHANINLQEFSSTAAIPAGTTDPRSTAYWG